MARRFTGYKGLGVTIALALFFAWHFHGLWQRYRQSRTARQTMILNRVMPRSFGYIFKAFKEKRAVDPRQIKPFLYYYEKVVQYRPQRVDALGMSGFCYYWLGDRARAKARYQDASRKFPAFFWFSYNLGLLYWMDGQYAQARAAFAQALRADPAVTMAFIGRSKRIYGPLLARFGNAKEDLARLLKQDYQASYIFSRPDWPYARIPPDRIPRLRMF